MRISILGATVASAAVVASVALASPSSANPAPANCARGDLCVYPQTSTTDSPVLAVESDWTGNVHGRALFNNGSEAVTVDYTAPWIGGTTLSGSICLDSNPADGQPVQGQYQAVFYTMPTFTKVTFHSQAC